MPPHTSSDDPSKPHASSLIEDAEVAMTSSGDVDCSDLVQATKSGHRVQHLINDLPRYFDVEAIAPGPCYSKVECVDDVSKVLDKIKDEFKKELLVKTKKIARIVKAIVPSPKNKYYISPGVRLLVFQDGLSTLEKLVNENDCIVLIPVVILGSAVGTVQEQETGRQVTITFEVESELVISGRCSIYVQPESKAVCVVLSVRNKE